MPSKKPNIHPPTIFTSYDMTGVPAPAPVPVYAEIDTYKLFLAIMHPENEEIAHQIFEFYNEIFLLRKLTTSADAASASMSVYRNRLQQMISGKVVVSLDEIYDLNPHDSIEESFQTNPANGGKFNPHVNSAFDDHAKNIFGVSREHLPSFVNEIYDEYTSNKWYGEHDVRPPNIRASAVRHAYPSFNEYVNILHYLPIQWRVDSFVEEHSIGDRQAMVNAIMHFSNNDKINNLSDMPAITQWSTGLDPSTSKSSGMHSSLDLATHTTQGCYEQLQSEYAIIIDNESNYVTLRAGIHFTKGNKITWVCKSEDFGVVQISEDTRSPIRHLIMKHLCSDDGLKVMIHACRIATTIANTHCSIDVHQWSFNQ